MSISSHDNHPTKSFCSYCGQEELHEGDHYYTHDKNPTATFCCFSCAKWDLETTHGNKVPCNQCGRPIEYNQEDLCERCDWEYCDLQRRRAYNM